MLTVLWLLAAVLVIAGIVTIVRSRLVLGLALVIGLLVGSDGASILA